MSVEWLRASSSTIEGVRGTDYSILSSASTTRESIFYWRTFHHSLGTSGGKWFGHVLVDTDDTVELCDRSGLGLCFDVSHAALACNRSGESLVQFAASVTPHVRHLHVSDGAGTGGEGLQIGEGDVNFIEIMPVLLTARPTLVPEIWMGHHLNGRGFRLALDRLTELVWASQCSAAEPTPTTRRELDSLTVPVDATVIAALQVIDRNRMGIAFVVDDRRVVIGVATDGDIRSAIVRGSNLHTRLADVMTRQFTCGKTGMTPDEIRARLPGRTRRHARRRRGRPPCRLRVGNSYSRRSGAMNLMRRGRVDITNRSPDCVSA